MFLVVQLQGLQSQLEFLEQSMVDKSVVSRQEAKIRELETRLEFERTQVKRMEVRRAPDPFPVSLHLGLLVGFACTCAQLCPYFKKCQVFHVLLLSF